LLHKEAIDRHWIAYKGSYPAMAIAAGMVVESVIAIQIYIVIEYLFLTKHYPESEKLCKEDRIPNGEVMNNHTNWLRGWSK
jgi:hypothetical protein